MAGLGMVLGGAATVRQRPPRTGGGGGGGGLMAMRQAKLGLEHERNAEERRQAAERRAVAGEQRAQERHISGEQRAAAGEARSAARHVVDMERARSLVRQGKQQEALAEFTLAQARRDDEIAQMLFPGKKRKARAGQDREIASLVMQQHGDAYQAYKLMGGQAMAQLLNSMAANDVTTAVDATVYEADDGSQRLRVVDAAGQTVDSRMGPLDFSVQGLEERFNPQEPTEFGTVGSEETGYSLYGKKGGRAGEVIAIEQQGAGLGGMSRARARDIDARLARAGGTLEGMSDFPAHASKNLIAQTLVETGQARNNAAAVAMADDMWPGIEQRARELGTTPAQVVLQWSQQQYQQPAGGGGGDEAALIERARTDPEAYRELARRRGFPPEQIEAAVRERFGTPGPAVP